MLVMTSRRVRFFRRENLFAITPGPGAVAGSSGGDTKFRQQPLREQQPCRDDADHPNPVRHVGGRKDCSSLGQVDCR
jgi:hypothetical protein